MTGHPVLSHVELFRASGVALSRLGRSIEACVPRERSERVSLFPPWDNPECTDLLSGIVAHLEGLGLVVDSLLLPRLRRADEVAIGEEARQRYLTESSGKGLTWPGHVLILSDVEGASALLASDPDGTTLYIDFWGSGARAVGDSVFDLVWARIKDAR